MKLSKLLFSNTLSVFDGWIIILVWVMAGTSLWFLLLYVILLPFSAFMAEVVAREES